jgi:hypothetical protein
MPAVISPPEFYNQSNLISGDIDRVSGISEYQRGGMPEIRRTATEAAISQDASNARSSDKLAIIERGIGECARRLVMLAQQYMTAEGAIRVAGKDAQPIWVNFDRDYIQGDFDFEVEGGSTQPVNESFRRQMALQVVDAMAPFASAGIIDMPKLATYVLQYGFGIKSAASFVTAAPPPMPPEMAGAPQGALPQGPPPEAMMQGAPPQGGAPAGLPPELAGLPPEVLMQLMQQMQQGGGMPPQGM